MAITGSIIAGSTSGITYAAGGGGTPVPEYDPEAMTLGTGGWYKWGAGSSAGDVDTFVMRFKMPTFTVAEEGYRVLFHDEGQFNRPRMYVLCYPSDHADPNLRNTISLYATDVSDVNKGSVVSPLNTIDGQVHTLFAEVNFTTAAWKFYIDGEDADDLTNITRVAPTTGLMDKGFNSNIGVGANRYGTQQCLGTEISYIGHSNQTGLDPADFSPSREIDEIGWTEWGGVQPLIWKTNGQLELNDGIMAFTRQGTMTGPA